MARCLNRRIPDMDLMRKEVAAWELDRNNRATTTIDWRFTTENARIEIETATIRNYEVMLGKRIQALLAVAPC